MSYDPATPTIDIQAILDDLIEEVTRSAYQAGDEDTNHDHELYKTEQDKATQAIQRLIVRARLEELDNLPGNVADFRVYMPKRIVALQGELDG